MLWSRLNAASVTGSSETTPGVEISSVAVAPGIPMSLVKEDGGGSGGFVTPGPDISPAETKMVSVKAKTKVAENR